MKRLAFIIRLVPGKRQAVTERLVAHAQQIRSEADRMGLDNFSLWHVENLL